MTSTHWGAVHADTELLMFVYSFIKSTYLNTELTQLSCCISKELTWLARYLSKHAPDTA